MEKELEGVVQARSKSKCSKSMAFHIYRNEACSYPFLYDQKIDIDVPKANYNF